MSIYEDLIYETEEALKSIEKNVSSNAIARVCINLLEPENEEILIKVAADLYDALEDAYEEYSDHRLDRAIKNHGRMMAETIILDVAKENKLLRDLSEREEDRFSDSAETYYKLLDEGNQRSRRGSRRNSGRNRDDRDDRSSRGRTNRNSRDNDRSRRRARGDVDERTDRNQSDKREPLERPKNKDQAPTSDVVVSNSPTLGDKEVITKKNYEQLPKHLLDLPMYYVGFEKLIYTDDQVHVVQLGDNFKVDYEKHRTDLFLSPNRKPVSHTANVVEMLEKDLLEAAKNNIKAFVEKEGQAAGAGTSEDNPLEYTMAKVTKPSVVLDGVYDLGLPLFGYESSVRTGLASSLGKDDLNTGIVAASIQHIVASIPKEWYDEVDTGMFAQYQQFKLLCSMTKTMSNLKLVRELLTLASEVLPADCYEDFHRLINQAVCDAITVSTKVSVTTKSVLTDFDALLEYISNAEKEEPSLGLVISTNLSLAMPIIEVNEGDVHISRNFVFLPFSKNELIFGSVHRYATIDEVNKKELFSVVDKIFEVSTRELKYSPLTTLITSDNAIIYVFPNKGSTKVNSYYLTKEI